MNDLFYDLSTHAGVLAHARACLSGKRVVLSLSGGQDSTTCLYLAREAGAEVHALTVHYGQRHALEIGAAKRVAAMADAYSHELLHLTNILKGTSPLVSTSPLEQYAGHQHLPGGIEKTFVPMRNAFFLTLAANRAVVLKADYIIVGVSEEDYGGYPDCREAFLGSAEAMIGEALGESVESYPRIYAPLLHLNKCETVRLAKELPGCLYATESMKAAGLPYGAIAYTHTAYDGQYPPTGHDHATLLRAKGFEEAGEPDPLVLRAHAGGLMPLPNTPNYAPQGA